MNTTVINNRMFYVFNKADLQYAKKVREEKLKECTFHAHNPALPLNQRITFKKTAKMLKREIHGIEQLLTLPLDIVIFIEEPLLVI